MRINKSELLREILREDPDVKPKQAFAALREKCEQLGETSGDKPYEEPSKALFYQVKKQMVRERERVMPKRSLEQTSDDEVLSAALDFIHNCGGSYAAAMHLLEELQAAEKFASKFRRLADALRYIESLEAAHKQFVANDPPSANE